MSDDKCSIALDRLADFAEQARQAEREETMRAALAFYGPGVVRVWADDDGLRYEAIPPEEFYVSDPDTGE